MVKLVKRSKSTRQHGRNMGTHGTGARKNKRKSGHKGGIGMAGSGKRADHKKTLVQKLYGNDYFGKQGITSRKTKRDTRKRINVGEIQSNLAKYSKDSKEGFVIELKNYKILGKGDVKDKLLITCFEASESAIKKVEAAGGKVTLKEKKVIETPFVEHKKKKKE